jgi:hypothetical protein
MLTISIGRASNVGLTAKVGTLGPGADLSIGMGPFLGLRFGASGYSFDVAQPVEDYGDISANMSWLTYGAYLDWFPAGTGFRITAGAMGNDNEVKLTANPSEPLRLYGVDYPIDDFDGKVSFSAFAPYLGIGYGNAAGEDGRWHFACDFGAMFQGEPSVETSAHTPVSVLQPYLDRALEEKRKEIEDDLSFFRIYPVIAVGVSFRF